MCYMADQMVYRGSFVMFHCISIDYVHGVLMLCFKVADGMKLPSVPLSRYQCPFYSLETAVELC